MDLNLQEKVILITQDDLGICEQIFKVLKKEGASPVIICKHILGDTTHKHHDSRLSLKNNYALSGFINIEETNRDIDPNDNLIFLDYIYKSKHVLEDSFPIINIKDPATLSLKLETYKCDNLTLNMLSPILNKSTKFKINTIAFTANPGSLPKNDKFMINGKVKKEIAYLSAFLLSAKSNHLKGQSIYINSNLAHTN